MTAAGLALIAGGIATLISFRAVLFGDGRRGLQRAGEIPRGGTAPGAGDGGPAAFEVMASGPAGPAVPPVGAPELVGRAASPDSAVPGRRARLSRPDHPAAAPGRVVRGPVPPARAEVDPVLPGRVAVDPVPPARVAAGPVSPPGALADPVLPGLGIDSSTSRGQGAVHPPVGASAAGSSAADSLAARHATAADSPADLVAGDVAVSTAEAEPRRSRRGRRRAVGADTGSYRLERHGRRRSARVLTDDEDGGLASIGLADFDDEDAVAGADKLAEGGAVAGLDAVVDADDVTALSTEAHGDDISVDIPHGDALDEAAHLDIDGGRGGLDDVPGPAHTSVDIATRWASPTDEGGSAYVDAAAGLDREARGSEQPGSMPVRYVDRSDHRYGDRIEGWVRPEYRNPPDEPRPGEYWTPIPVDLINDPEPSAKGYGWPAPVERLPAAPSYPSTSRFDLLPASEPTEVVPAWPGDGEERRSRSSRSWAARNEKPSRRERPDRVERPDRGRPDIVDPAGAGDPARTGRSGVPTPGRRRPRPRPRPEAGADRSTVYVSRHAAEPPA